MGRKELRMYKLTYTINNQEHVSYYSDLSDAQQGARDARIHLGAEDIWISRED